MNDPLGAAMTRAMTRGVARELLAFEMLVDLAMLQPDPLAYLAGKRARVLAGLDAAEQTTVAADIRRELEKAICEMSEEIIDRTGAPPNVSALRRPDART